MPSVRTPGAGDLGEHGQALILGVLGMTLVLVIGVIVVDFGLWFSGRASVVNALDQASTAASQKLPTDGAGAIATARQYAHDNDFDIDPSDVGVTFRCIVGDRNGDGQPDRFDIPAVCPQLTSAAFTCINQLCYAMCATPTDGTHKCNTIVVKGQKTVKFGFAPIFGVAGAQAPGFVSAACSGACGGPPTLPLDLVLILDRTGSMSFEDLDNVRNGAEAILQLFDPAVQHVALGILGPSTSSPCANGGLGNAASSGGSWLPVPLSDDYQNSDGTLNTNSLLDETIRCASDGFHKSSVGTNLGDPVKTATDYLMANGRPGVKKGIILLTDGEANEPQGQTQNTGYLNCGANAAVTSNSGDNDGYETTPSNACADGGGSAVDANSGNGTSTSCASNQKDRHLFYNYGISIPGGTTVSGIQVRLDASVNAASGTPNMCVQMSWDGGTTWTSSQSTASLTTSEQTYTLGSSSDNWGHTWSASQLSNANFRVRVTDVADDGGGASATGTLIPTGNGFYTAWTNTYTSVDDQVGSESCSSSDSVISTGTNSRESDTVSLSSIPNGATITSVDITPYDRGDAATGGTYQTFARLNGTDLDSGANITTTSISGCNPRTAQNIDVADTVKSGATTLEIGVLKTAANTNAVRVGVLRAVVHYVTPVVSHTFNLDWVAVRVYSATSTQPCNYANQQAATAKAVNPPIEIFTIGFGVEGASCSESGPYSGALATKLLADMATQPTLDDGGDGPGGLPPGCVLAPERASENADGDHFLCEAKGVDLEPIFRWTAEQLAGGSRLIKLPPSMLP